MTKISQVVPGGQFGRLTIIRQAGPHRFECRCECGQTLTVMDRHLAYGNSKSCGCLQKEAAARNSPRLASGISVGKKLFKDRQGAARKRNLSFTLTLAQFFTLSAENCHYCGTPPAHRAWVTGSYGDFVYSGMDRVDSKKGYELSNVVPCCWVCNQAKSTLTVDNFLAWVHQVAGRHPRPATSFQIPRHPGQSSIN